MSTAYPSDLTDAEWACVQRYLTALSTRGRPRTHPLRRILDAIFYIVRTGCAWRYLPSDFSPWPTVFYHFRRFRLKGIWRQLCSALHRAERERMGRHLGPERGDHRQPERENRRRIGPHPQLRRPYVREGAQATPLGR